MAMLQNPSGRVARQRDTTTPVLSASRRQSITSDSSDSSSPEGEFYDDGDSVMYHANDSQSSLGVSLEEMELDSTDIEERCRVSPISKLPAEILIAVFSKLSSSADLRSCMLVSKVWARNSVDLLWHRPATHSWKNLHNIIQTARKKNGYFVYNDLIKRLNLALLTEQISDGTLHPLADCKRIERLTLTGCSRLTDLSVANLIDGNRNLLAVDISGLNSITDRTLFAVANSCFRLQGLNITKCTKITDESLVAVARNCRRMKRLKFNDCSQLTDYSILAFADNCHDIVEIDLHGCVHVTDMSVTALIAEGRQMKELRLAHCTRITDEAFLHLPDDHYYDSLRVLDLTDCHLLQDAGLQKIVNAAPRLRNLVLAKCRNISDKGVMAITRLGKNLHYIHLGHCSRITDYGVAHLVTFCNRIRYIDLACCVTLTDDSVSLLATLPKLKRIGLVKCVNITDNSLRALAKPKASANGEHLTPSLLERLHLSYCGQLSISGVRKMLINCPHLTHLSLTGVQDFLRNDLLEFCRDAPQEFNEHQRDVFCVFSGNGVKSLRQHLEEKYADPTSDSETDSQDEAPDTYAPGPPHTQPGPHMMFGGPPVPQPHHTHGPFGIHTNLAGAMFMGLPPNFHNLHNHPLPPLPIPPPPPLVPLLMAHPAVAPGGGIMAVEDEGDEDLEEGDVGGGGE